MENQIGKAAFFLMIVLFAAEDAEEVYLLAYYSPPGVFQPYEANIPEPFFCLGLRLW